MSKKASLQPIINASSFGSMTEEQMVFADDLTEAWLSYSLDMNIEELEARAPLMKSPQHLTLAGLIAVHQGYADYGKSLINQATSLPDADDSIRQLLLSGAYRTLACGYLLKRENGRARRYFKSALAVLENLSAENLGKNIINAQARLGLLKDGYLQLEERFVEALVGVESGSELHSSLTVIHSELELLKHELLISQRKSQLYLLTDEKAGQLDYSDTEVFKTALQKLSPSQLGQDLWALEQHDFKRNGFFVEFGATDGILLSNSYILEKYFGWSGLCAEPNPKFFEQLKANRTATTSNECISAKSGETVDFIFADEYGGMADYAASDGHADKRKAYESMGEKVSLTTISLNDFLNKHRAPKNIDYLSIDTEGSEYDILCDFPFHEWDVKCITVEHNYTSAREKLFTLLTGKGYKRKEAQFDDWYYKD